MVFAEALVPAMGVGLGVGLREKGYAVNNPALPAQLRANGWQETTLLRQGGKSHHSMILKTKTMCTPQPQVCECQEQFHVEVIGKARPPGGIRNWGQSGVQGRGFALPGHLQ